MRLLKKYYAIGERTGLLKDAVLAAAAEDIEWWAAGPPELLPWAGSFKGRRDVERWFSVLREALAYDRFEPYAYVAQGRTVVELIHAAGKARMTGRRYESDIVRIWEFRGEKLVRVRSFYDTAAYVRAYTGT